MLTGTEEKEEEEEEEEEVAMFKEKTVQFVSCNQYMRLMSKDKKDHVCFLIMCATCSWDTWTISE